MTHAVDQTGVVEALLVQQTAQILAQRILILPVRHMRHQIVEHLAHLDIRTAVLGTLEGAERRRNCRIGVRAGGRYHMHGKGRIVAAAVLCVEHQREVKELCLEGGELAVGAEHVEDVLRKRKLRIRLADDEALPLLEVVRLIAVNRDQREQRDQRQTLAQYVRNGDVIRLFIIGIERKHALGEGVHHVVAGRLHDDVAGEDGRKHTQIREELHEIRELLLVGELAEQEEVGCLLEAGAVVRRKAGNELLDIDAAVIELAVTRNALPVHHFGGADIADMCQTCENALAVQIAQTAFDVVFGVELRVNGEAFAAKTCERIDFRAVGG